MADGPSDRGLGRAVLNGIAVHQYHSDPLQRGRSLALEIALDGTLHVLYGLNGAGKTITLDAIRSALTNGAIGERGAGHFEVVVHLTVEDEMNDEWDGDDEFWTAEPLVYAVQGGVSALQHGRTGAAGAVPTTGDASMTATIHRIVAERLEDGWLGVLRRARAEAPSLEAELAERAAVMRPRLERLAAEVASQRRFALVTKGHGWHLAVACSVTADTPAMLDEMTTAVRSWVDVLGAIEDAEAQCEARFWPEQSGTPPPDDAFREWEDEVERARRAAYEAHDVRCLDSLLVPNGDPDYISDFENYLNDLVIGAAVGQMPLPFYWGYEMDELIAPMRSARLPWSVLGAPHADVEARTRELIANAVWIAEADAYEPGADEYDVSAAGANALAEVTGLLSARASQLLASFLPQAPQLHCTVPDRDAIFRGQTHHWWAEPGGEVLLTLDELSFATERLARLAIEIALAESIDPFALKVVLLDEPDLGLHRLAERRLFTALRDLSSQPGTIVLASSHSPTPFSIDGVSMHHVFRRPEGNIGVARMTSPDREGLEALGLSPSDLLPKIRVVLLVEGRHDEVVLQALFGNGPEAFEDSGVALIAMHGGRKAASVVDSTLLWEFTDAKVAVLLDRMPAEALAVLWNDVQVKLAAGEPARRVAAWFREAAADRLASQLAGGGRHSEVDWIVTLGSRAIERGIAHRLVPMGHPADDILAYLPEGSLGAPTWQAAKRKGLVTDERLLSAVGSLDTIPPDLAAIHRACIDLAL